MTDTTDKSIHGQWTSEWGFILATTGAAVGLGNIWKFPYIAGENGGGAFVIIYLVCILLIGIPLLIAEVMLGRRGRQNPAGTMRRLALESNRSPLWQVAGIMGVIASFLILSYYSVIAGWALDYVYQSVAGHFEQANPQEIKQLFQDLVSSPSRLIYWHSLIMIATVGVVIFGVEKGLERCARYMFPTMLILLLIITVYSMGTGYFGHGFSFLFHPNFHDISARGILVALGHAFFTLSLATGSIMMYGAYLPKKVSIIKASLFVAAADTLIALIAGLAIFPIVFANGLEPGEGPGLIFKTLPIAFGKMPYGQIFGTFFFIMLVFAAFTSAISLLEPSTAWLIERAKISRRKATVIVGFLIWLLGFGSIYSFNIWSDKKLFGLNFFTFIDYLTANIMLPLGGLLIALFAAWLFKREYVFDELNIAKGFLYRSWQIALGVITPVAILAIFFYVICLL